MGNFLEQYQSYVMLGTTVMNSVLLLILLWRYASGERKKISIEIEKLTNTLRHEIYLSRQEMNSTHKVQSDRIAAKMMEYGKNQSYLLGTFQSQLHQLTQSNDQRLSSMSLSTNQALKELKGEVRQNLEKIRQDNSAQLEKMRSTVDEKLHKTLENRLGQSFKQVSDSLDKVQKGLGEMRSLANGVGDLKKVLSNVKTRGVLGEIQLANILEQLLAPEQYALNVATIPNSQNHVEFAIKFPGKNREEKPIWLPIDSKFPMDRYEAVVDAYENGHAERVQLAVKNLLYTVKTMARDIQTKYIAPPHTTDFGILFLPIEGLYAEVVRHTGLIEELQRDYRIMVAGPTNLAAFLNSLQMGFQSIAIEKRSSEVWKILGAVKMEFGKFGDILTKTQKKLQEASNVIDKAEVRTRAIERKLRVVEELPPENL